jgi:RNA 3'-terminal phosphate cyclase (ATP)
LIEIDGSEKSGSGTILRMAVALCAIKRQPLHIYNIRQNRPQPGLKPQHLEAVLTAAKLCDAELDGAKVDSRELWFRPKQLRGGRIEAEIGTAGSISMLLMTVLPMCANAETDVYLHISKGGTDVPHSPTINYMRFVFLQTLKRMGLESVLTVQKYGYYPKGNGEVTLAVTPCKSLRGLCLEAFGSIKSIKGVSVCTFLADRNVAERQAKAAKEYLRQIGCMADIQIINDASNPLQKGSSLVMWAETDKKAVLGADAIGELRKTSDAVGTEASEKLYSEIAAKPTVDAHLADMLIPYMALAQGRSTYLTRAITEHLQSNIWLAEMILNTKFSVERAGKLYKVEKTC